MNSSPRTPAEPTRLDFIDALRGIAVLGVLLVHAAVLTSQTGALGGLGILGYRGVQLFYTVSAFTLFLSLDSGHSERYKWSNFFIRRFFRIAPLFYLAAIGNLLLRGRQGLSTTEIVSGFVFLNGLSPRAINIVASGGWSIAVETSFYLLVPILFVTIKNLKNSILACVIAALGLGGASFYMATLPQFAGDTMQIYFRLFWLPVELPVFLLGIVAYFVWKHRSQWQRSVDPVLLIVGSAFLFFLGLPVKNWGLYLSCIPFIGLIAALSIHSWPPLVNRFTRFMGKISYSMYLMHFFILYAVERMQIQLPPSALGFVAAYLLILAGSIPLCLLTFTYIEQPGIRLGRNWIRKREANATADMLRADVPANS
jgi:peptidoglycan/LPS O-acetylase OafA/YrhL